MVYPTFEPCSGKGIIPFVNLPENFKELFPEFYKDGRKKDIENYTTQLQKVFQPTMQGLEIRLQWDNEKGLTNISLGGHSGFDLNESGWPGFQEHNLGMRNSFIAGAVAMKYVSELLKSE